VTDRTKANRRGQRVLPPEDHDPNVFSVIPWDKHDRAEFSVMPPEDHDSNEFSTCLAESTPPVSSVLCPQRTTKPNDYSVLPPEHKRRRRSKERLTNRGTA